MQPVRRRLLPYLATMLVLAATLSQPLATRAAGPHGAAPFARPQFYLAVGDSISYGYQQRIVSDWPGPATTLPPPAAFNPNAVSLFAGLLRTVNPRLQTANYACPGATTSAIISSEGCPTSLLGLHDPYATTQLDAAIQYVQGRGAGVITVDAGANDLLALRTVCGGFTQTACLQAGAPGVIGQVGLNMARILLTLRQASPTSTIIVLQLYNPFAAQTSAATPFILALNQALGVAAGAADAQLANAYVPFNITQPQPQVLCALSNICGRFMDIHPSYLGYAVIARLFTAAYVASFSDTAAIPRQLTAYSSP